MWNKLAEELDIPEDDAPLQGQAYSEDYQDKEKKNKSGTKADEATDPDAKEDIAKEAFWVGVVKMARANGLSTAETLGLCTQIDGGRIESENDPYIYGAMLKDAEDDLSDIDDLKRMHDVQAEEEQQGKEILGDQEIQTSTEGSPLQNSKMKEETELAEIHNDQDIQYEGTKDSFPEEGEVPEVLGDHPPKNHGLGKGDSLKEAAFQAGFDEVMRDLQ